MRYTCIVRRVAVERGVERERETVRHDARAGHRFERVVIGGMIRVGASHGSSGKP